MKPGCIKKQRQEHCIASTVGFGAYEISPCNSSLMEMLAIMYILMEKMQKLGFITFSNSKCH